MDITPTRFWLTDVNYLEEKRAVAVEFSHLTLKRIVRQPFFPSFFLSAKDFSAAELKEVLCFDKRRFSIAGQNGVFKASAATFSGLNELADFVFKETGIRPIVLQPERQFLLQNNWSYFDCFAFFSENEFAKSNETAMPEARLPFFSEPLHETVQQLAIEAPELAEKTIESIALSSLLRFPLTNLPSSGFMQTEAFLENLFWESGISRRKPSGAFNGKEPNAPKFSPSIDLAMVDFSGLWPILLTKPLYNLGIDSIGCKCCKPESASESNVLPNSLAFAEFLKDGFFFESCSSSFAASFHESHSCMESRLRRMHEFCLKSIPIGPFFRNQKEAIPLADAIALQQAKEATILGIKEMHWFCLKKESVVSREISSLAEKISLLENSLSQKRLQATKEHGVIGIGLLSRNPDYLLQQKMQEALSKMICSLPGHLCNAESCFFDELLCSAIEAVQSNVLASFAKFASEQKSRVVASAESSALLKSANPFALIKQFSQKQKIPALIKAKSK